MHTEQWHVPFCRAGARHGSSPGSAALVVPTTKTTHVQPVWRKCTTMRTCKLLSMHTQANLNLCTKGNKNEIMTKAQDKARSNSGQKHTSHANLFAIYWHFAWLNYIILNFLIKKKSTKQRDCLQCVNFVWLRTTARNTRSPCLMQCVA